MSPVPAGLRPLLPGSLRASSVRRSHGAFVVLDGVDITVSSGDRIAVVGPNGVGKSTLLRILAGLEAPDAGEVRRAPADLAVAYLSQEPDSFPGESVVDHLARRTGVADAEAKMDGLQRAVGADTSLAGELSDAVEQWVAIGGDGFEARVAETFVAVGLDDGVLEQEAATLSGGQSSRLRLAAILLSRHDIVLLDEPTNDLDFAGLDLLRDWATSTTAGVVVVSHDRAFLAETAHKVVELDDHTRRASTFDGGWDVYLAERERARRREEEAYASYVEQRDRLREQARRHSDWERRGVRRVRTSDEPDKKIRWGMLKGAESQAGRAKKVEKALERLEHRGRVDKSWEPWELRLDLTPDQRSGAVVVTLTGAVAERGGFRLGPVDLDIRWQDRVAITGSNGSGKTTLLGMILGRVPLTRGEVWTGPSVQVGEIDQRRLTFARDDALIDAFVSEGDVLPEEARSLLAKFSLGADDVIRPCRSLSPGERTRAHLAMLAATGVNCLVLDEPTNHLDLPAIEELERVITTYPGTVLLVTHDRRLLAAFDPSVIVDVESLPSSLGKKPGKT